MTDFKNNSKCALFFMALVLMALDAAQPALAAEATGESPLREMVLVVEAYQQPPTIDFAEILDDPKQTRQRLGWIAALRVGMTAGMYYLQKEAVKDSCRGSYCGVLEEVHLGLLQADAVAQMTEVFAATVKNFEEAGSENQGMDMAWVLNNQAGTETIQSQLAAATRSFVSATTEYRVLEVGDTESTATHALRIGIDEVGTAGNYVNAGLSITLRGTAELVDLASGETVDSYAHLVETPERSQVDWSAVGAGVIAQDIVLAMARLTETLSEEVLMVVNSPSLKGKGYLMQPVDPTAKVCLAFCKGKMWGNFGFKSAVATRTPVLSWEPFEERYALDPLYPDADNIRDVHYDVRIYEAVQITRIMGDKIYGAGPLLQEIRGIDQPEFTFEDPLPACTRLLWTVRARFVANDTRHLTRWSGHYKERQIEHRRKVVLEGKGKFTDAMGAVMGGGDQSTFRQETSWYYGFRTPQLEGDKKCKWRG